MSQRRLLFKIWTKQKGGGTDWWPEWSFLGWGKRSRNLLTVKFWFRGGLGEGQGVLFLNRKGGNGHYLCDRRLEGWPWVQLSWRKGLGADVWLFTWWKLERSVPPALAGAAQQRAFVNSSCWYVVLVLLASRLIVNANNNFYVLNVCHTW